MRVLLRLSEGAAVEPELYAAALQQSESDLSRLQIGYLVIDPAVCSPELIAFAHRVFQLTLVTSEGGLDLYRTPLAPPISTP